MMDNNEINKNNQSEKRKKKSIVLISLGILICIAILFASSYSYWRISKKQGDSNEMIAACLDFDLSSVTSGISLNSEWPISDSDALANSTGYTFKVTNNCKQALNYIVGLESLPLTSGTYIDYSSVGVGIGYSSLGTYSSLSDVTALSSDALSAKELFTDTLNGNSSKTYTLKLWIKDDAPITEQSKAFNGKVIITGGQSITNNSAIATSEETCFTIDENEQIVGYDATTCGKNVVIPAIVNSTKVKSIDTNAFKTILAIQETTTYKAEDWDDTLETNGYLIFPDTESEMPIYVVAYNDEAKTNLAAVLEAEGLTSSVPLYLKGTDSLPEKEIGQAVQYFYLGDTEGNFKNIEIKKIVDGTTATLAIDTLDLSQTVYLEKVEKDAFSTYTVDSAGELVEFTDGLDGLTFGDNDAEIFIEPYAFANLETDELTLHSALGAVNLGNSDATSGLQFAYSKIKTLNVVHDEGYDTFQLGFMPFMISDVSNVNVAEGVTIIGDRAFEGITSTAALSLPSTLTKLGDFAFTGIKMNTLNLPDGLTSIGQFCCSGVESLDSLIIPNTVTNIGADAFGNLTSVTNEFKMSNSIVSIGEAAFADLTSVNDFTLPATLTNVGRIAFRNLPSTVTITIKQADGSGITTGSSSFGSATIIYAP